MSALDIKPEKKGGVGGQTDLLNLKTENYEISVCLDIYVCLNVCLCL